MFFTFIFHEESNSYRRSLFRTRFQRVLFINWSPKRYISSHFYFKVIEYALGYQVIYFFFLEKHTLKIEPRGRHVLHYKM